MAAIRADVMAIIAHPDDAEFAIAGTVAKWVKQGKIVVYVVCTNGDKGTSDPNMKPGDLARIREKEQMAAARVLGVREVVFLHYPDQGLEDTPEFRKALVRQIRIFRPNTVATSDPYRRYLWHRDHRIAGQVALDAIYPYARDLLAYPDLAEEGLEPHKVKEVLLWGSPEEDVNYRSDITETFETKLAALSCHKTQVGETLNADTEKWVRNRAKLLAKGEKFNVAEAFHREEVWL
ncbi:MAG: PIG-L deacetylase family protein [Dehalococcoidia bacterium]|nr:PIG-L deacetylase family protein [Dehalococcoidia bacterium]